MSFLQKIKSFFSPNDDKKETLLMKLKIISNLYHEIHGKETQVDQLKAAGIAQAIVNEGTQGPEMMREILGEDDFSKSMKLFHLGIMMGVGVLLKVDVDRIESEKLEVAEQQLGIMFEILDRVKDQL